MVAWGRNKCCDGLSSLCTGFDTPCFIDDKQPSVVHGVWAKPVCVHTQHNRGVCKQHLRAAMFSIYLITPRGTALLVTESQTNKQTRSRKYTNYFIRLYMTIVMGSFNISRRNNYHDETYWDITLCRGNIPPPSSGSKNKPSKKLPAFTLVCCSAYV
jgi:hypothetical protein